MVEGARLESVYARKGIEGSNPSLSAELPIESILSEYLGAKLGANKKL